MTVTNSDGDVSVIDCDEGCSAPPDRIIPWNRVRIRVGVLSLNLPLSESLIGRSYVDVCCSAGARNKSMVRNRSVYFLHMAQDGTAPWPNSQTAWHVKSVLIGLALR